MSIKFIKQQSILLMEYYPEFGYEGIKERLNSENGLNLKNAFFLTSEDEYQIEEPESEDEADRFVFCLGKLIGDYYKLNKEIFGTIHDFYISREITITRKLFIAYRNISILRNMDDLVDRDVYITTDETEYKPGYLPFVVFSGLLEIFPNSTELTKYARVRIARVLNNYFEGLGNVGPDYERYLNKRLVIPKSPSKLLPLQLSLFHSAYKIMQEMLKSAEAYSETHWQIAVCEIVRMIYPKYILAKREQVVGTDGRHKKKPDFLLVDSGGYVDILEIKKPNDQRLITHTEYRNNYVADRDLSGAIVQIEKYIYCLNHGGKAIEEQFKKNLQSELPLGMKIHVTNPQGMLLMGRSDGLTEEQLFDLEIIKRQHKNIIDIMTYDDLMSRIDNIIRQLQKQPMTDAKEELKK